MSRHDPVYGEYNKEKVRTQYCFIFFMALLYFVLMCNNNNNNKTDKITVVQTSQILSQYFNLCTFFIDFTIRLIVLD